MKRIILILLCSFIALNGVQAKQISQNIGVWQYHLHLTIYNGATDNKYNRINPIKYLNTKFEQNGNKIQ